MVKNERKVHRSHVLIGVMVVLVVGLIVFACTQRSGDSGAVAGQAVAGDCTDTDPTNDIYVNGMVNSFYEDSCVFSDTAVQQYYCNDEGTVKRRSDNCANGCSNGVCLSGSAPPASVPVQSCTDTDPTDDIYVNGMVNNFYQDTCAFQNTMVEQYYCDATGTVKKKADSCPSAMCSNGVCSAAAPPPSSAPTPTPTPTMASGCTNSTAMVNYSSDGTRNEINCQGGSSTGGYGPLGTCSNGQCVAPNCANGACASYCYDTDGGDNSGVAGSYGGYTSYGSYEGGSDTCRQAWEITEHFCQNGLLTYGYRECPTGTTCQTGTGACR